MDKLKKYLTPIGLLVIIAYQAVAARMSGGGLGAQKLPQWLTWLPEVFFAVAIGAAAGYMHGLWWVGGVASAWAYIWMQTGHGTAYHMAEFPAEAQGTRKQTLSYVIDPICKLFKQPLGEVFYCWIFMGLKGLLIHAPLGWFALPALILWPVAYYVGRRLIKGSKGHAIAELLSGAFSGLLVALYVFL